MEKKKSFVLYADMMESINHLSFEEKGILFDHILKFINGQDSKLEDRIILTAWKPIELQLKRDLEKWDKTLEQRSKAGKASAESRKANKHNSTKSTHVESVQRTSTNSTDNVNVNDTVNDNDNENDFKKRELIQRVRLNNQVFFELKASDQWLEIVGMQFHRNKEDVLQHLGRFFHEIVSKEDYKTNTKDAKNHFINWIKKDNPITKYYPKSTRENNVWGTHHE
jgi:hypothetical protein